MAVLGRPYPLFYMAKNGKSGLNTVQAHVLKPNGDLLIPITLVEMAQVGFSGRYTGTIYTVAGTDPEGDYLVSINEPDGHGTIHRVEFSSASSGGGTPGDIGINRRSVLEAEVHQQQRIVADIVEKDLEAVFTSKGRVEATFYKDELEYFLDNNQLEGSF